MEKECLTPAEGCCFGCNEGMSTDCSKLHRRQKNVEDHNVISIDEIIAKPEFVIKFGVEFRCDGYINCKSMTSFPEHPPPQIPPDIFPLDFPHHKGLPQP
ncbi:hypothetical protein CHS0354_025641 [Potamilus streckersoni]|uniref:Uncharacterized protein n=1 Tax=Potamilus streckersoni TaxID=2493646 RepID=A0AAE0W5K8_9BIVA|nr:hypothetical protein CHS0354_025641 [Potamilus streckersoni]